MGLRRIIQCLMIISMFGVEFSYGAWNAQEEIISGLWGMGDENFGIEYGDSGDRIPSLTAILLDGNVTIRDQVNEREIVYRSDGSLFKVVPWYVVSNGEKIVNPEFAVYTYPNVQGYREDGTVWIKTDNYFLKSPVGELLQTYTERPLELGRKRSKRSGSVYKTTISYPDVIYTILANEPIGKYYRDENSYLYHIESFVNSSDARVRRVHKYDRCGKQIGMLELPLSTYAPEPEWAKDAPTSISIPIAEYGDPIVSSAGDVYTWVRSKTDYKIVKWVWVDEATDPKGGPDIPEEVQALPSTSGIYLTWNPSPHDPGCVTGYDIERATSAAGVFSNVTTVPLDEKQTYSYNDTGATAGATWYYRISAKSDIGNSDPVEVNATRP